MTDSGSPAPPDWADLVRRIRCDDPVAMTELYNVFERGIRFYLCRQLGPQDLDDRVHDAFLVVTQAIRRGDLREPERLMGFVRTVVRRQVAANIDNAVHSRRHQANLDVGMAVADHGVNPEQAAIHKELEDVAFRILKSLPRRDREILIRFYIQEESQASICREMGLTDTQFRLIKSRAKGRFTELAHRRMERRTRRGPWKLPFFENNTDGAPQ